MHLGVALRVKELVKSLPWSIVLLDFAVLIVTIVDISIVTYLLTFGEINILQFDYDDSSLARGSALFSWMLALRIAATFVAVFLAIVKIANDRPSIIKALGYLLIAFTPPGLVLFYLLGTRRQVVHALFSPSGLKLTTER